jgi:hypothetical protein
MIIFVISLWLQTIVLLLEDIPLEVACILDTYHILDEHLPEDRLANISLHKLRISVLLQHTYRCIYQVVPPGRIELLICCVKNSDPKPLDDGGVFVVTPTRFELVRTA